MTGALDRYTRMLDKSMCASVLRRLEELGGMFQDDTSLRQRLNDIEGRYVNRANNDVALAHALDKYQELANSSSVSPAAIDAALRVLIGVVDRTFSDNAILAAKVLLEERLGAESEDVTAIASAIERFRGPLNPTSFNASLCITRRGHPSAKGLAE